MGTCANRLNISIITTPSGWGGTEIHTVALARTLENNGHDVSIVEFGSNLYKQKMSDGIPNVNILSHVTQRQHRNPGFFRSIGMLLKLNGKICVFPKGSLMEGSWCLDFAARLIFSHYITIEHLAASPKPLKLSVRHCGGLLPGLGIWWYKRFLAGYIRSLWPHQVICVSKAVGNILKGSYRFPEKKINTIQNGIDSDRFKPNEAYKATARKMLGIPEEAQVFGSIGRLNEVKGFELALEQFMKLVSIYGERKLWFVLVGSGPERANLEKMVQDPEIRKKVIFIDFTDKPWEMYPAFDFFLMPSRNEGLPLTLLEAMACGCCPIATGVGGIPEVITSPESGWIVIPNDMEGFFQAMKEAVELESDKLCNMSKKAREQVVMNFRASTQFPALADFIEKSCS